MILLSRFCVILVTFRLLLGAAQAQVRINEVLASNGTVLADAQGDYEDWIELYNESDESVNLSGWGLSDNPNQPFKWAFPNDTHIAPAGHLLVWGSGKDTTLVRSSSFLEVEGLVLWLSATSLLDVMERGQSGEENQIALWPDASGVGNHGRQVDPRRRPRVVADDLTGLPLVRFEGEPQVLRIPDIVQRYIQGNAFTVVLLSRSSSASFGVFGNGDFGAGGIPRFYLQRHLGSYHALSNLPLGHQSDRWMFHAMTHDGVDRLGGWVEGEWSGEITVPVVTAFGGTGSLWIPGAASMLVAGDVAELLVFQRSLDGRELKLVEAALADRYRSQDGGAGIKWQEPADLLTERLTELHTNFRLSEGEPVVLTRSDGSLVDEVRPVPMRWNVSWGRKEGHWAYFSTPTPGAANGGPSQPGIAPEPRFSHAAGFYTEGFDLELSVADADVEILYTLDGSEPSPENLGGATYRYKLNYSEHPEDPLGEFWERTVQSFVYKGALAITNASFRPNGISGITTTFSREPRALPGLTQKGTVVRARAFREGWIPSRTVTHTFLVDPNIAGRFDLGVVSVAIDEPSLFDYDTGIYVPGALFDRWRMANPTLSITNVNWNALTGNFRQNNEAWERRAHVEFFEAEGRRQVEADVGVRIHGNFSRLAPRKSLRIYTRPRYGSDPLEYPLFGDLMRRGDPGRSVDSFRTVILRNSGTDHQGTLYRDAMIQSLMEELPLDTQASRPVVHFINGEYWGIMNLRERQDEYYIEQHYGIDPSDVVLMSGQRTVDQGTVEDQYDYLSMVEFARNNDLGNPDVYAELASRMDIDNFTWYYAAQIYAANHDWPAGNVAFWRKRTVNPETAEHRGHDGRWRWLVFDTDIGFLPALAMEDSLRRIAVPGTTPPEWSTQLFRSLLASSDFRCRLINGIADLMNHHFHPERVNRRVDAFNLRIERERTPHFDRWGSGVSRGAFLKTFAQIRGGYMMGYVTNLFNLPGTAEVVVEPPTSGWIQLNSIRMGGDKMGGVVLDEAGKWTGTYFQGVPVRAEAIPASGYRFAGWSGLPNQTSPILVLDPVDFPEVLQANFERVPQPTRAYYWNFNDPAALLTPTFALHPATLILDPGTGTEVLAGTGQGFAGTNARPGDPASTHLRLNQPIGTQLTFNFPTTGLTNLLFRYETRRSGMGAGLQLLSYSLDGTLFHPLRSFSIADADPVLVTIDLSAIPEAASNPLFAIRIELAQGDGGTAGNQRLDNVTLEGFPVDGFNLPPRLLGSIPDRLVIAGTDSQPVDLEDIFADPNQDLLTYSVEIEAPELVSWKVSGSNLSLHGLLPGQTRVTVSATDGSALASSKTTFLARVHPAPHRLDQGSFAFTEWAPKAPQRTYPPHLLFLQSAVSDPDLHADLEDAYHLTPADYHADDAHNVGFPYNNTRRTRINGLGSDGIAFLNTGQDRDLGGALLAVDTRGGERVEVSWKAQVLSDSTRTYGLRLQYRLDPTQSFQDVLIQGQPIELLSTAGSQEVAFQIQLPTALVGQPYLQLLWRYHAIAGTSGPRPQIRLDDIQVSQPLIDMVFPPEGSHLAAGQAFLGFQPLTGTPVSGTLFVNNKPVQSFDRVPHGFLLELEPGDTLLELEWHPTGMPEDLHRLRRRVDVTDSPRVWFSSPQVSHLEVGSENLVYPPLSEVNEDTGWRGNFGKVPGMVYGAPDPHGGNDAVYIPGADMGGNPIPNASGVYLFQAPPLSPGPYLVQAWLRSEAEPFSVFLGMSDLARVPVVQSNEWQSFSFLAHYPNDPPPAQYRTFQVTERVTDNPGWFLYDPRVYAVQPVEVTVETDLPASSVQNLALWKNDTILAQTREAPLTGTAVVDTPGFTVLAGMAWTVEGIPYITPPLVLHLGKQPRLAFAAENPRHLVIQSEPGASHVLERSVDLTYWEPVLFWEQSTPVSELVIDDEADAEQAYFRVRKPVQF